MKNNNIFRIATRVSTVRAIMVSTGVLFGVYAFAIASTTVAASDTALLHTQLQEMRTKVAELEGTYYAKISDIDENLAQEKGYFLKKEVRFAKVNNESIVAYLD